MKKIIALVAIAIFATSAFSGCIDSKGGKDSGATDTGENFSFTTIDGEKEQLKDYRGKVIILNMMTTHCPYCNLEMIELEKAYKNYTRDELIIISIDVDSYSDNIQKLKEYKESFEQYIGTSVDNWIFGMDNDGSIWKKYGKEGTPVLCIFDQQGNLHFTHEGLSFYSDIPPNWPANTQTLKPIIDELLNKT